MQHLYQNLIPAGESRPGASRGGRWSLEPPERLGSGGVIHAPASRSFRCDGRRRVTSGFIKRNFGAGPAYSLAQGES